MDTLRTRSLALLATGSIIAGLFAGHTSNNLPSVVFVVTALAAYVATATLTFLVQRPRGLTFSHQLDSWIKDLELGRPALYEDIAFVLSRDLERYRRGNQIKLRKLYKYLSIVCVLLGIQVIAWGIASVLS